MKRSILLLISHSCNLKCKYCYEKHKDSRKMTLEQAIRILEKEFYSAPEQITNVDLLGGEPLANYQIIPGVCEWIWKRIPSMQIFIRTNGTLLRDDMKAWFASHKDRVGMGLSFDGTPQTNLYNRGATNVDLEYFHDNWPDVPVKITIFPDSVHRLLESVIFLHNKGFNITGGLAQGVYWSKEKCDILYQQMEKLTEYFCSKTKYDIIEPLYSKDFQKAYEPFVIATDVPCCWERDIVHTYDCNEELLPCHMFSVLVQGEEKRKDILNKSHSVVTDIVDSECQECPIRWSCVNCMALNFQHFGEFGISANKHYSCEAHKITAYWSAMLLANNASQDKVELTTPEKITAIKNAIRYIRESEYGKR